MKRWQLILLSSVCFCVGAISATVYEGIADSGREFRRGRLYDGLTEKLNLTADQQVRVDEIVDEARHRMVALSKETKPRFRQIKAETRDRIREILDAEQLSTFNAICSSCDRRRQPR